MSEKKNLGDTTVSKQTQPIRRSRTIIPFPFFSVDITDFPYIAITNNHDEEMRATNAKLNDMQQKINSLEDKIETMNKDKTVEPPAYQVETVCLSTHKPENIDSVNDNQYSCPGC